MDEQGVRVGRRVKELRRERGISLSALAAAAGVGKGSLSELESGTRNPTLATLYAVAGPLGVTLAALLSDEVGASIGADGVSARLLDTRRRPDGSTTETYALSLVAGADRTSPAHGRGVLEHLHVTDGVVRVGPVGDELTVAAGESRTWTSDRPHRYAAVGGAVEAVLVITTPAG